MEETVKQVVKILKSPGCRYAFATTLAAVKLSAHLSKTPVFVKSAEVAMELAPAFAKEK